MAWDAYNVTEDADLGLKLFRLGYRVEMLTRPTLEDAPEKLSVWTRQRTRWMKGWMQTWLVHMRNPAVLLNEIGIESFFISQILFAGMFISALLHVFISIFIFLLINKYLNYTDISWSDKMLFAMDSLSVLAGYGALSILAYRSTTPKGRGRFGRLAALLPVYWTWMSLAAWRGAWQLVRAPHFWEKTPHESHSRCERPPDAGDPVASDQR